MSLTTEPRIQNLTANLLHSGNLQEPSEDLSVIPPDIIAKVMGGWYL